MTQEEKIAQETYKKDDTYIFGDASIVQRLAYLKGCTDTHNRYQSLFDYCKGILYHWGTDHDNVLEGLGKILDELEK